MNRTGKQINLAMAIFLLCAGIEASAHEGEHHGHEDKNPSIVPDEENQTIRNINAEYIAQVKPIFHTSCMNCHGSNTQYPWYYVIPGAKQLIDYDVKEAKVHLDMTNDFPFGGHGSPTEDLEAIKKAIENKTMPPLRYRAMHWSSALEPEEAKVINAWIEKSLQELEKVKI